VAVGLDDEGMSEGGPLRQTPNPQYLQDHHRSPDLHHLADETGRRRDLARQVLAVAELDLQAEEAGSEVEEAMEEAGAPIVELVEDLLHLQTLRYPALHDRPSAGDLFPSP